MTVAVVRRDCGGRSTEILPRRIFVSILVSVKVASVTPIWRDWIYQHFYIWMRPLLFDGRANRCRLSVGLTDYRDTRRLFGSWHRTRSSPQSPVPSHAIVVAKQGIGSANGFLLLDGSNLEGRRVRVHPNRSSLALLRSDVETPRARHRNRIVDLRDHTGILQLPELQSRSRQVLRGPAGRLLRDRSPRDGDLPTHIR